MPKRYARDIRAGARSVAITGGGGGIGEALGRAFGRGGARVVLLDVAPDRLSEVAGRLCAEDIQVETRALDITDPQACAAAFAPLEAGGMGDLDVLVNNAGISHRSLFADTDPEVLRRVMEVNFFGAVNCTRAALPSLRQRRGSVVALSSVAGFAPLVGRSAYAASKHALHGFFDTLRTELSGDGVRVLLVCPAFVATDLDKRHLDASGHARGDRRAAVGRPLQPVDVADAIVRAVADGDRELLLSPVAHASRWLKRLAPAAYDRLMLRGQGGEFGLR